MAKNYFACFFISISFTTVFGQIKPEMRYEDKVRIREAINISNQFGDKIWKGINDVPFVILIVNDSIEFLINHPTTSKDFTFLETDSILKANIFYRKRQFEKHLLSTFPAVNGISCIVIGTPENTQKKTTNWIVTLLHEHFHQYENEYPDYYKSIDKLGLSGGDQTGMWMLNYPFPYDSSIVIEQYKKYTIALSKALATLNTSEFETNFNTYKAERNKFKSLLSKKDYSYFSFQVWQEGIARYTEYKFLESVINYSPSKEVISLKDFIPFNQYKDIFYKSTCDQLIQLSLEEDQRDCFYAIGFAEGLLLDKLNPKWQSKFFTDKFYIEDYCNKFK